MIPVNPEAIGDPNQTPVVYIGAEAGKALGFRDSSPPSPAQRPGQTVDLDEVRRRYATFAANSLSAIAAVDSADDVPFLLAEVERLTAHSTTLNTIGWRMAEALGRVPEGATAVAGNPEEQLSALLADLDAAREAQRRAEEVIAAVRVWRRAELPPDAHNKVYRALNALAVAFDAYEHPEDAVDTYETQENTER